MNALAILPALLDVITGIINFCVNSTVPWGAQISLISRRVCGDVSE